MLMNYGARSHVCGGLWAGDSIACHAVCFHLALGAIRARATAIASMGCLGKDCMDSCPCLRPQEEDKEVVFFSEGNVGKPVDGAVCGSLSPLQPSATWTTWTSRQQWWDMTGGISPSNAWKRKEKLNLNMRTGIFLAYFLSAATKYYFFYHMLNCLLQVSRVIHMAWPTVQIPKIVNLQLRKMEKISRSLKRLTGKTQNWEVKLKD